MFGIGFFALRAANKRLDALAPDAALSEKKQINMARSLAQVSIALFVMNWGALVLILLFHINVY